MILLHPHPRLTGAAMCKKRYPVYHKGDGCGEIGMFTAVEDPQPEDLLLASEFFKLDGSEFIVNEECKCGHCGQFMLPFGRLPIQWVDYEDPRDA